MSGWWSRSSLVLLLLAGCAAPSAEAPQPRAEEPTRSPWLPAESPPTASAATASPALTAPATSAPPPTDPAVKRAVIAAMSPLRTRVAECYDRFKQMGTAVARFAVAGDGSFSVDVSGDLGDGGQAACLCEALRHATLPARGQAWEFRYPMVFR